MIMSCHIVDGLAGIQLFFFVVASFCCCGYVTKAVLITQGCFSWAVLTQGKNFLLLLLLCQSSGWDRSSWERTAGTVYPK